MKATDLTITMSKLRTVAARSHDKILRRARANGLHLSRLGHDAHSLSIVAESFLDMPRSASTLKEYANRTHGFICWHQLGYPSFELSEALASSLLLTDCSGIDLSILRWPFPTFAVVLPERSPLTLLGVDNELEPVRFMLFHEYHLEEPWWWTELFAQITSMHRYVAAPAPSQCLEAFLTTNFAEGRQLTDQDRSYQYFALRLLANLALYVADLKSDRPKDAVQQADAQALKRHERKRAGHVKLGGSLQVDPELLEAARRVGHGHSKVVVRFVVRGHWRNQACGPKHSERRPKWIQPHMRGPASGPEIPRLYRVDVKPEEPTDGQPSSSQSTSA